MTTKGDFLVPAAPLARQLWLAGHEIANGSPLDGKDHGFKELARRHARRFPEIGFDVPARQLYRILKQRNVFFSVADRWCCVLGIHPVMLWPELYAKKRKAA